MILTRHAVVLSTLLSMALVPTVLHNYLHLEAADGRSLETIPAILAGLRVAPPDRKPTWTKETFASFEAFERLYVAPDGRFTRLVAVRSYDAKRLYHHPELAIAYGTGYDDQVVTRLPARPEVPVRMLRQTTAASPALALYVLLHDDTYVENPYTYQLRSALARLFAPHRPMTLLFVYAEGPGLEPADRSLPAQVLFAAIDAFEAEGPTARP